MLFDTFVTTVWKPSCAKLRECTKVGYESALNCHILPQWSGRDMDEISVVARQLGHSDIQTTARYYLKPDLSVLKDMQKAWQKLILTC